MLTKVLFCLAAADAAHLRRLDGHYDGDFVEGDVPTTPSGTTRTKAPTSAAHGSRKSPTRAARSTARAAGDGGGIAPAADGGGTASAAGGAGAAGAGRGRFTSRGAAPSGESSASRLERFGSSPFPGPRAADPTRRARASCMEGVAMGRERA